MNSPNNLLFDSEMAISRLRKAFESAPESDLDDADSGGTRGALPRLRGRGEQSAIVSGGIPFVYALYPAD